MSAVESMQRGHNGRIEEAFAQAKARGEAAFVTFVTAGFPEKDGESTLRCVVHVFALMYSRTVYILRVCVCEHVFQLI